MGMPNYSRVFPESNLRGKKQKKRKASLVGQVDANANNCKLCFHYNSTIFMDYLSSKELVVVEQPWRDVMATLPAALDRKAYGT